MSDVTGTEGPPPDAPAAEAPATAGGPDDAKPDPHALNEAHAELLARLEAALADAVLETAPVFGMPVLRVRGDSWRHAAEVLRGSLECDYLSYVAGIDWMPAPKEGGEEAGGDTSAPVQPQETTYGAAGSAGRFQVFACAQSTTRHTSVTLKTDVDEGSLLVESWVPVYPGADWHERECWEMFGFVFDGHPALRHLYLPSGFEGHPLRKDYPLLARVVKPWPGLVDVEPMPGETAEAAEEAGEGEPA